MIPGLQAELFYVREGVINEYAIKFVVPVPAQVHKLHFTWENLAGRPVSLYNSTIYHIVKKTCLKINIPVYIEFH